MNKIKNQLRRAFTIVELVVVIAVIAALAAILIPTFVNVIQSANESNDMITVKNLNTAVATEDVLSGVETASDAINAALDNGYSVSNLSPTSEGNVIVYDQESKRFALLTEDLSTVVYADASTTKTNFTTYTTWVFATTGDATVNSEGDYVLSGTNSYILKGDEWNGVSVKADYGVDDCLVSVDTVEAGTEVSGGSVNNNMALGAKVKTAENGKTMYSVIYNVNATNFNYEGSGVNVVIYGTTSYITITAKNSGDTVTVNGICTTVTVASANAANVQINASFTYLDNQSTISVTVNSSSDYTDVSNGTESEELYSYTTISVDSNGVVTPGTKTSLVTGKVVETYGSADDWTYSGTTLKTYSGTDSEVIIPVGTTVINYKVFKDKTTITSVVIPDSVTTLNGPSKGLTGGTFYGCTNLATITIGSGLESIGSYAFYKCTSLSSVVIPDSVTTIGDRVFYECTNLASISIGSGLKSIGESAFYKCTSLSSVIFPAGLESIGNYAFECCSLIESVNIPNGVTTLGTWVFRDCSKLEQVIIGNGITAVQEGAFYYCTSLKSVSFPEGLKTIGNNAFLCCEALESISLPEGITSINGGAFACTGYVTNNKDSESGVYIGNYLIYAADIENYTVKEGTTLIAAYAFSAYDNVENPNYFTNLKTVTLPDSVKYINNFAFEKSTLESINLGNGVVTLGTSAFNECTSLTSITFPSSITSIGKTAFKDCTSLATVTFAENSNLETISAKAFMGCTALTEIVIPESTNSITINIQAFSGCTSLKKATISSSVTKIYNKTFENCGTALAEGESLEIYFASDSSWTVNKQTVTVEAGTNYAEYFTSTYLSNDWTKQ